MNAHSHTVYSHLFWHRSRCGTTEYLTSSAVVTFRTLERSGVFNALVLCKIWILRWQNEFKCDNSTQILWGFYTTSLPRTELDTTSVHAYFVPRWQEADPRDITTSCVEKLRVNRMRRVCGWKAQSMCTTNCQRNYLAYSQSSSNVYVLSVFGNTNKGAWSKLRSYFRNIWVSLSLI